MIDATSQDAWPVLMEKLKAFVTRRVGASEVDDVVQDALMRIQRGVPKLRDAQRLGPWVYQVTRSAVADHLRAAGRLETRADFSEDEQAADAPFDARDDADELRPGLLACLAVFVAELPSPYREAVTLTELEGLTQREAAAMLGISLSGMKSRVQRGRARLRERFLKCCAMTQDVRGRVTACDPRAAPLTSTCACGSPEPA
jgi:RNA polymerase sigma-70 factor, ECF subfamily